jgi:threonine/homoserine/homoserine lactone efflux protein
VLETAKRNWHFNAAMNERSLLAFIVTAAIIELTPGPNMGYLAVLAASAGRRAGFAATAGVAVGLLGIGIASSLGLAAIVAASNLVYELLRWGGAVYLVWLAWEGWRDAPDGVDKPVDASSHTGFFLRGFVTNLLNPKAGIFYLSVLPAFIDEDQPLLPQTAVLLAVYVAIATVVHSFVVLGAAAIQPALQNRGSNMVVRRVMSASLVLVAGWLLYTTHRATS